jgi:hypothetical protein
MYCKLLIAHTQTKKKNSYRFIYTSEIFPKHFTPLPEGYVVKGGGGQNPWFLNSQGQPSMLPLKNGVKWPPVIFSKLLPVCPFT